MRASSRPRLARFVSFVFLVLACFALPQQAAAQNSINLIGTTFTISDATATEGGTARFEITTEPAAVFNLNFSIRYTAGSADLADLGSGRPSTLDFTGRTSITLEVPIADDDTVEGEETFTVQVTLSPGFTIQATGTIIDNDGTPPPAVDISIAPASATEGGDIRFPVTLSTQLLEARTLNIGYTAGSGNTGAGLGDLGSDRPTTLTLPTGTTTVNLVVPTVDDTDDENNETFTVTLSLPDPPANPANTLNITTSSATGTINDNDETADAEVSIANASVAENAAAGSIGFTVSLDRAVDNAVTLAVAYTAGTATLADDLGTRPTTVTINRGTTEATLAVPVTNDALVERNETFTVTLSEGTTALPDDVTIGTGVATGTITDNDTATVALSATAPPPASEGGTITFTVELDNPVAEAFSLGWTASNGTATVDDDLDDQSSTVEIAANARTATFSIPITNDDDLESSETFTVALTGAPTGLVNIAPSRITVDRASATGTINASDTGDGNTVNIGNRTVAENVAGGSIGFTVSLDRAVGSAVTLAVAYTAGTASLDDDLGTPLLTTVTIDQGNTSATLAVPIANEVLVEGDETFTVTLSEGTTPLPEGVEIGNGTATGTITNDDEAEIRPTVADVNEAAGSLIFRPGVTAPLAQDLVLSWSVTGGTASAADFSQYVSSGTVTIPARQNSGSILFFPRDDDAVEGSETLTLTFAPAPGTTLPDGVTFRSTTATATIRDSDEVDIDLRVVADVSETDERLTFRPVLTARLTQDITLSWEVTGGTASADDFSEYVGSGTVTIEAGRGGAPIRFFPLDDDAVEGDETLEVTISAALGTLPRGVNLGATTTATATIADDDEPPAAPVAPEITTQPVNQSVTVGGSATFTVVATGTPTYQWRRDGTNIDGATSASYTISNVALTNAGEYTVVVTNTAGTVTSSAATLTVTAATGTPTITTQPVDQSVTVGGSATFTVTATGTPTPTYQWRRDGTNIAGATSATYTIANAALSDAGAYSVVVTNPAGSDTSRNATLTVTPATVAPEITTQPVNQSVTVGENATFTVTATGTPTPTYQWRFEGSDIAGATSASYTVSSAALTNAGDYTVVVTNTAGTVTSSAATLTVTPAAVAPQITTQPVNQSVTVGENATFTVTATGTPTPTYQWRFEGTNIAGATSASYTVSSAALTNAGDYTVVVTNTAGEVTSSAATLTVTAATVAPQITTQPVNQSVTVGETATFTVTATGTPTPTYQWRFEGSDIDGATSASYTLSNAALTNAGDYTVVVTNTAGTVTSSAATLTVTAAAVAPAITTQPVNQSVTVGETATFTVTATGTPTPTYQWRFEGTNIAGATLASYTLSSAALTNAGDYTVVVTNTAGTVTSSAATLTVTAANDDFLSVLTEPRRTAAMSALRRHVGRFERLTSSAAHNRLNGRGHADSFGISEDAGSGNIAKSVDPGDSQWGVWLNSAYAGFSGESGGRQADLYTGVDYLNANGNLVGGVLLGIESAQLDVGQADYESEYRHYGFYAGLRLTERLIWDGAVSYGTATPQISLGDVYADYDARRFSIRTELTGTYDLLASGALTVSPQLGLSYARERLGDFIDSVDGIGRREVLEFGRISAGPRFIWRLPTAREHELEFGTRLQWDVLRDAEGRQTSLSGAVDLGMRFSLTSKLNLGVFLEADGIGNEDEFSAYGGRLEINFGF